MSELEELGQKYLSNGSVSTVFEGWEEEVPSAAPAAACTVVVVVGRTCQALPSMCSHLQICASASNMSTIMIKVSVKNFYTFLYSLYLKGNRPRAAKY